MGNKISIIGSINTDIVCQTNKIPKVGETVIGNVGHVFRGYDDIVGNLRKLGADISFE